MPKVTVDGTELEIPQRLTVLQACALADKGGEMLEAAK